MLSKRATEVLSEMIAAEHRENWEGAEIVCEGIECWLGETRVSRRTVTNLLRHVAISLASEPGSIERYTVSGTGRKIHEDPEVADRVIAALVSGIASDSSGNPL